MTINRLQDTSLGSQFSKDCGEIYCLYEKVGKFIQSLPYFHRPQAATIAGRLALGNLTTKGYYAKHLPSLWQVYFLLQLKKTIRDIDLLEMEKEVKSLNFQELGISFRCLADGNLVHGIVAALKSSASITRKPIESAFQEWMTLVKYKL